MGAGVNHTDKQILSEFKAANAEVAVRTLYRAYGSGLYGFAWRRLRDTQLAEEVVQDVLLRAWRAAESYDPGRGSLRSWLFEIARNAVIDAQRHRAVRPPLAWRPEAEIPDQIDTLEQEIVRWQVQSALSQLSGEHRQVITLIYFDGHSLREVAEQIGIPLGTVKSRCFYALESLRLTLEEFDVPL